MGPEKAESLRLSDPLPSDSSTPLPAPGADPAFNAVLGRKRALVTAVGLLFVTFLLRAYGATTLPQQPDERHWVNRSARVVGRISRGDLAVATSHLGHPGLSAALAIASGQVAAEHWNSKIASRFPRLAVDRVAASRLAASALSSLVVPLMFLAAMPFIGWRASLLASVLLTFDSQHIATSRQAHLDGTLTTFVTATTFCFLYNERRPSLGLTLLGGVLFGLAIATKPTAIALLPAFLLGRLILRRFRETSAPLMSSTDILAVLVSQLVLFALWTKLWDPNHNFISLHRIKIQLANWIHWAGEYLELRPLATIASLVFALAVPGLFLVFRRRVERPGQKGELRARAAFLSLCVVPLAVLLLCFNTLPLENIARFWAWVAGLSSVRHMGYGVPTPPEASGYLELWWLKTPPLVWAGIVLALVLAALAARRADRAGFGRAFSFCAVAVVTVVIWTSVLGVSAKQAFRYVLPVYPLLLCVSAFGITGMLTRLRVPVSLVFLAAAIVPMILVTVNTLAISALYFNPLAHSFADAVARGMIPPPHDYHIALATAQSLAPADGPPDDVEVIGDFELIRSEYSRRFPPEIQRLRLVPFRGGFGSTWIIEFAGRATPRGDSSDFRTFSEKTFTSSYQGVPLMMLHRMTPLRAGEIRSIPVRYARTRTGTYHEYRRDEPVLRIHGPDPADHAFFDLPVLVQPGSYSFEFHARLRESGDRPLPAPDDVVLRLGVSPGCTRDITLKDMQNDSRSAVKFPVTCSFDEAARLTLNAYWLGTVSLELGNVRVELR